MRIGVNPEKSKSEKNFKYYHRIIIPVYIPNDEEPYYIKSLDVFDACLNSLFRTINFRTTAVTIINNASFPKAGKIIEKYRQKNQIDKVINYDKNRGKVYAVVSEAKASYEPFITIADADVLFFSGWETAVFEIFNEFPSAGVVSPVPLQNLAFNKNYSVFFDNFLLNRIKHDKIVLDKDCELFLSGMGNTALLKRNNRKFSWKEKQYFLKKKMSAVIGAGHFVATYRKEIFNKDQPFPVWKFENGFEDTYLDEPADKLGWYRLSTPSTFAYHMGNEIDDFAANICFENNRKLKVKLVSNIKTPSKSKMPYWLKSYFFRALKRIKKL
ncbi:glycosyltransferase family A protein [Salinimicrobium sp. GXAS 041]|uniref:glycosyltransferase family A protein n=1 Tax=Salinimicrobium sp. GXAS 041 TaxID=3400806 RepID=UPI003C77719E